MVYQPPEIRRVIPDIISINILMDTCTFTGRWHLALNLLSAVPLLRASANHISHLELIWTESPCHGHTESPQCDPLSMALSCTFNPSSHVSCLTRLWHLSCILYTDVYCIPCMLSQVFLISEVCSCARVSLRGCLAPRFSMAWLRGLAQASTRWLALAARLGSGEDPWMCCRGWMAMMAMGWSPMTSLAAPASARVERPGVGRWGWNFAPLRRPLLELKMLKSLLLFGHVRAGMQSFVHTVQSCSYMFILSGVMW